MRASAHKGPARRSARWTALVAAGAHATSGLVLLFSVFACTGRIEPPSATQADDDAAAGTHGGHGGGEPRAADAGVVGQGQQDAAAAPMPMDANVLSMPMEPARAPLCQLGIAEVAAYQAVKVPLWREGALITNHRAPVIARRRTLFRVFLRPGPTPPEGEVRVRLAITGAGDPLTLTREVVIAGPSREEDGASTANFLVPGDRVAVQSQLSVELVAEGCAEGAAVGPRRVPGTGTLTLSALASTSVKVRLVPMRYDADGSNRMPDTSDEQLARYRDLLEAMFPIEASEFTWRDPVGLTLALDAPERWDQVLDGLRGLRERDGPADDVYYVGLVVPADDARAYCKGSCVAGVAYHNVDNAAVLRVGLVLGYPGDVSARALVHELGHAHGLAHAPCNASVGLDPDFPYSGGTTGSWGFDMRRQVLLDPAGWKDFMGYCEPTWISDYAYGKLLARVRAVGFPAPVAAGPASPVARSGYRALQVTADGRGSWGATWPPGQPPAGQRERAEVLGPSDEVLTQVDVFRIAIGDSGAALVLVPEPRAGWARVRVIGARAIAFAEPPPASVLSE